MEFKVNIHTNMKSHIKTVYADTKSNFVMILNNNSIKEKTPRDIRTPTPRQDNFSEKPATRFSIMEEPSEDMSTSTPRPDNYSGNPMIRPSSPKLSVQFVHILVFL